MRETLDIGLLWNELLFDDNGVGLDVTCMTGAKLLSEKKVEIKLVPSKGLGVFSSTDLQCGTFLFRTVAPLGSASVAYTNQTHMKKYAIQVGEVLVCVPLDSDGNPVTEPQDPGFDLYAFINEPGHNQTVNVQMHPIYNTNKELVCIGYWAIADIEPGDELCVHYGMFERSWSTPNVPIMCNNPESVISNTQSPQINMDVNTFMYNYYGTND